jgi:3',5'-cyclic AMP phosphodiesterase CpdA
MDKRKKHAAKGCLWLLAALLLPLLLLPAGGLGETRVMAVSDLHYLAPELYEGSDLFLRVLRNGDGKIPQYGEELLDALERTVLREKPDALLVSGDLTFNGEKASHQALAERFALLRQAGVPVWVIPGNHDINTGAARGYTDTGWYWAEGVTEADFMSIYQDFMLYDPAGVQFSYAVPLSASLWAAMTDVSYYQGQAQTFGLFSAGHREWLQGVLERAREAGAEVITVTHHSLIAHTEFMRDIYQMIGFESMLDLVRQYGVRLNLSGHLHIQHAAREAGVTDAALGAFCLWPHRYAVVTLSDDGALHYEARSLDGADLPEGFLEESRAWFLNIAEEKARAGLADASLPEGDADSMAQFAARFNLAYFSGEFHSADPAWRADPAYALWQEKGGSFGRYLTMVMNEPNGENLKTEIARRQ